MDTLRNQIIDNIISILNPLRKDYPTEINTITNELINGKTDSLNEFIKSHYQELSYRKEIKDFIKKLVDSSLLDESFINLIKDSYQSIVLKTSNNLLVSSKPLNVKTDVLEKIKANIPEPKIETINHEFYDEISLDDVSIPLDEQSNSIVDVIDEFPSDFSKLETRTPEINDNNSNVETVNDNSEILKSPTDTIIDENNINYKEETLNALEDYQVPITDLSNIEQSIDNNTENKEVQIENTTSYEEVPTNISNDVNIIDNANNIENYQIPEIELNSNEIPIETSPIYEEQSQMETNTYQENIQNNQIMETQPNTFEPEIEETSIEEQAPDVNYQENIQNELNNYQTPEIQLSTFEPNIVQDTPLEAPLEANSTSEDTPIEYPIESNVTSPEDSQNNYQLPETDLSTFESNVPDNYEGNQIEIPNGENNNNLENYQVPESASSTFEPNTMPNAYEETSVEVPTEESVTYQVDNNNLENYQPEPPITTFTPDITTDNYYEQQTELNNSNFDTYQQDSQINNEPMTYNYNYTESDQTINPTPYLEEPEQHKEIDINDLRKKILDAQLNYINNAQEFIRNLEEKEPDDIYKELINLNDIRYIQHSLSKLSQYTLERFLPYVEDRLELNKHSAIDMFIIDVIRKNSHSKMR
ncbi:MAG: hypothetical protein IJ068_03440 [Bacilli bacterium]|nr:hypothetical protein [Bacilli bacterium]